MNLSGIELFTKRLRLVPLGPEHVDLMLSWVTDPAVTNNSQFWRDHSDRASVEAWVAAQVEDDRSAYFAAFMRPELDTKGLGYLGNVHLLNINKIHDRCQGGITLRQAAWNHGFAQEMMPRLMRYAFSGLGMNKIYLELFTTNEKGIHLWTKVGFKVEGILREHYLLDGEYHDMLSLSFLRSEFDRQYSEDGSKIESP